MSYIEDTRSMAFSSTAQAFFLAKYKNTEKKRLNKQANTPTPFQKIKTDQILVLEALNISFLSIYVAMYICISEQPSPLQHG